MFKIKNIIIKIALSSLFLGALFVANNYFATKTNKSYYVKVSGAVAKPGIYEVKEGSTVASALQNAQIKENANLSKVDLAKEGNTSIYVPFAKKTNSSYNNKSYKQSYNYEKPSYTNNYPNRSSQQQSYYQPSGNNLSYQSQSNYKDNQNSATYPQSYTSSYYQTRGQYSNSRSNYEPSANIASTYRPSYYSQSSYPKYDVAATPATSYSNASTKNLSSYSNNRDLTSYSSGGPSQITINQNLNSALLKLNSLLSKYSNQGNYNKYTNSDAKVSSYTNKLLNVNANNLSNENTKLNSNIEKDNLNQVNSSATSSSYKNGNLTSNETPNVNNVNYVNKNGDNNKVRSNVINSNFNNSSISNLKLTSIDDKSQYRVITYKNQNEYLCAKYQDKIYENNTDPNSKNYVNLNDFLLEPKNPRAQKTFHKFLRLYHKYTDFVKPVYYDRIGRFVYYQKNHKLLNFCDILYNHILVYPADYEIISNFAQVK